MRECHKSEIVASRRDACSSGSDTKVDGVPGLHIETI
jgi:hypothetical protein